MLYPQIRLEAPGLDPLIIDETAGIYGQSLDLGDPVTRAVTEDQPDADGTIDTTAYVGARNITLALILYPDADLWALKQRLRAFTSARLRPVMFVQESADAPVQQITLRRSQWSNVIGDMPRSTQRDPEAALVTVQWVAVYGTVDSAMLYEAIVTASGSGAAGGLSLPFDFSLDFGLSVPIGSATIVNNGTADAFPIIRIYGPAGSGSDDITITNTTQGRSLVFTNLVILAGEYIEIDVRNRTIRYLSNPADSRYSNLNFALSDWFSLSPGINQIVFAPDSFTDPAQAVFTWRDAWL